METFFEKLTFPCAEVLEQNLGAPPTSYLCKSDEGKSLIDMTANSMLFYCKLFEATLRKSRLEWKILPCFSERKGIAVSSCFRKSLKILEEDVSHQSFNNLFSNLSFVSLAIVHSRQMPIQFDPSFVDKNFVVSVLVQGSDPSTS